MMFFVFSVFSTAIIENTIFKVLWYWYKWNEHHQYNTGFLKNHQTCWSHSDQCVAVTSRLFKCMNLFDKLIVQNGEIILFTVIQTDKFFRTHTDMSWPCQPAAHTPESLHLWDFQWENSGAICSDFQNHGWAYREHKLQLLKPLPNFSLFLPLIIGTLSMGETFKWWKDPVCWVGSIFRQKESRKLVFLWSICCVFSKRYWH